MDQFSLGKQQVSIVLVSRMSVDPLSEAHRFEKANGMRRKILVDKAELD